MNNGNRLPRPRERSRINNRLTFALIWGTVYVCLLNAPMLNIHSPSDLGNAFMSWMLTCLSFLIACYSAVFFAVLVPLAFLAGTLAEYSERVLSVRLSEPIIASLFEMDMAAMGQGIIGWQALPWVAAGLCLTALCLFHRTRFEVSRPLKTRLLIVTGYLSLVLFLVFLLPLGSIVQLRHPYDIFAEVGDYWKSRMQVTFAHARLFDIASLPATDENPVSAQPLQVILIIGEAARADHFSINGYVRETTPLLQEENHLISFYNVSSCGTSTHISVPCLMTRATRENMAPATSETSFISLFRKKGFYTLWVSEQGKYGLGAQRTQISSISGESELEVFNDKNFSLTTSRRNLNSHDSALYLNELEAYFQSQTRSSSRKMLAVFHMAGSHFPYHWRYTLPFRKYAPTCPDVLPQLCPPEALINSYDNSIVYADFFIAGVIDTLRDKNAILFYVSDHGEYLGEHGRFLHGQETGDAELRHVPMLVWTSDTFNRLYPGKVRHMREKQALSLRQEFLFHSILNCSNIDSPVINKKSSVCAQWDE